ncbi:thymocyte selection-associated high mobility group box protein TOX isoform X2 [Sceloporus undulatus]|uniref:thymocyte selection-associated high mobility group box protein TOX isoform X2 n=1 Tax=Sceloporus undulatus TaxID=8520 RepID=UPI001C4BCAC6|nr:thymocyte selection-associated high mobility group box protein TOX isoform X2 [Sceloporus undulatus]
MDVRFYSPPQPPPPPPPPPRPPSQATPAPETPCLGPSPCLDPYYCNKFDGDNMYMSMTEPSQEYVPASQSFPGPSLESEDFNIPPITPPSLPDHSLVHLNDTETGYPSLCHPISHNGLLPFHPQNMDLPEITVSNMLGQDGTLLSNSLSVMQELRNTEGAQYSSHPQIAAMRPRIQPGEMRQAGMMQHGQLTTINQSQLSAQLGLNMSGNNVPHNSPSPPGSKSATPSPSSSVHEDEGDDTSKVNGGEKRPASDMGKKPKTPKKKKKKDPNEPQKPVSAYALFFRDTQAAIKGQNPNATFGEVSKIVASMWDGLGEEQKQVYKKKTEAAKKEYLKQLAAYRASLVSKSYNEPVDVKVSQQPQMMNAKQSVFHGSTQPHSALYLSSHYHQQAGMNPHITAIHPNIPRNIAPKPNNQMPVTVSIANMAVSPPPSLQMSPPIHPHLSIQQHQPLTMQQSIGNQLPMQVQSALHSPTMQQGFTLQPDYQNIINPTSTAAQVVTQAMEYVRSGCRNPPAQSVDWNNDYCSNGAMQRDKALYLT